MNKRRLPTMTIQELIDRLNEAGDEKWRNMAEVRILNHRGDVLGDELDVFDVKDGVKSVDIYIPY